MLKKQITTKIDSNDYQVKFPTVGQYLDIENMKMSLTDNTYADLLRSNLKTAYLAIDIVDSLSFFRVVVPEMTRDLNVKSYLELDPFEAKKLVKVYKKQVQPWYDNLLSILLKDEEDKQQEDLEDELDENGDPSTINL